MYVFSDAQLEEQMYLVMFSGRKSLRLVDAQLKNFMDLDALSWRK